MFYNRFESLCSQRGVTMSKAATEAGINKSAVTYWKNHEEAKPTGQIAERLCAYFDISMSELYGDAQTKKAPTLSDEREIGMDDFEFAFSGEVKELTESDKQLLLSMARQLNEARKQRNGEKAD